MSKSKYSLGLLTGVLLAFSFPPYPFFLFAFIGLVPILYVFNSVRRRWLLVYLTFFIYHYATNWWISSWQKDTDPYLFFSGFAVAFVHPFFFMIPFLIYYFIQKKFPERITLLLFPFIWTAFEWFHSLGDLAYPWLSLGYTQAYNHYWTQIADIGGVWLVSFLIVLSNVLILILVKERQLISGGFFKKILSNKYFLVFLVVILLPYIYGFGRAKQYDPRNLLKKNESVRVGIIQPNINPWKKWETNAEKQIEIHLQIQDSLLKNVPDINLFVWSETAITFLDNEINANHNFSSFFKILNGKFALLTGFADFKFLAKDEKPTFATKYLMGDTSKPYNTYNSILLLNPNNSYQIYHKIRLTPFGEQIPYGEIFGFARSFLEWNVGISSWAKGNSQNNLWVSTPAKSFPIAPIICIESIYPDFCRRFIQQNASMMVIITNDGWYDYTFGPVQHYLIATFRAIENRRFLVRCANTGISGVVAPNGETIIKAPQYQRIGIYSDIKLISDKTIYTLVGEWLPYLSVTITLFAIIISILIHPKDVVVELHKQI